MTKKEFDKVLYQLPFEFQKLIFSDKKLKISQMNIKVNSYQSSKVIPQSFYKPISKYLSQDEKGI